MTNNLQHASTQINQTEVNNAGMAPALKRDNRRFQRGTLGYWANAAKKEITLISVRNAIAKRAATLG